MSINIYVGNLPYDVSEAELKDMFAEFGDIDSAKIISDQNSGRSKGFGFVEMADKEAGQNAISSLNGKEIKGRAIRVNEAQPKSSRGGQRKGRGQQRMGGGRKRDTRF